MRGNRRSYGGSRETETQGSEAVDGSGVAECSSPPPNTVATAPDSVNQDVAETLDVDVGVDVHAVDTAGEVAVDTRMTAQESLLPEVSAAPSESPRNRGSREG